MRRRLRGVDGGSSPACAAFEKWLQNHSTLRTVAIYSPLPGEVDLSTVVRLHREILWVYPKVSGHHLTFHSGDDHRPGAFGILEPHHESPEIPVHQIDAFVCPGLAFDKHGGRLGRGRGFYDRLLAQARPDALKIGVCHGFQVVSDTFCEPHDIAMDEVIF